MKIKTYILTVAIIGMTLIACKSKRTATDDIIIATPPKAQSAEAPVSTQQGDYKQNRTINWDGTKYIISVSRSKDESLPLAKDESGKTYYDNKISIKITSDSGTEVFNRTFTKNDFASYYSDSKAARDGALLGIVFDKISGGKLSFAASVGSPDTSSDNYCPMRLTIAKGGTYSIEKDNSYDEAIAPVEEDAN